MTVDTLAASYGVGRTVMLRALRGVTRPSGGRVKAKLSAEEMLRMRNEGMTLAEVGEEAGLTESVVFRHIERYEKKRSDA